MDKLTKNARAAKLYAKELTASEKLMRCPTCGREMFIGRMGILCEEHGRINVNVNLKRLEKMFPDRVIRHQKFNAQLAALDGVL